MAHIKGSIAFYITVAGAVLAVTGFYYNTLATQEQADSNTAIIDSYRVELNDLRTATELQGVQPEVYELKFINVNLKLETLGEKIGDIKTEQKTISENQIRILHLLNEIKDQ